MPQYLRQKEPYHIRREDTDLPDIAEAKKAFEDLKALQERDHVMPVLSNSEQAYYSIIPQNQYIYHHAHDYMELNYVVRGVCYQYVRNKIVRMTEGDLIVICNRAFHALYVSADGAGYNICFDQANLREFRLHYDHALENTTVKKMLENHKPGYYLLHLGKDPLLKATFDDLYRYVGFTFAHNSPESAYRENFANQLFFALELGFRRGTVTMDEDPEASAADISPEAVLGFIHRHVDTITETMLEEKFGFSHMGLYRFLKDATGLTYTAIVATAKTTRAMHFLQHSDLPVKEIAKRCGFTSSEYFSRFFRAQIGMTATRWRKYVREHPDWVKQNN